MQKKLGRLEKVLHMLILTKIQYGHKWTSMHSMYDAQSLHTWHVLFVWYMLLRKLRQPFLLYIITNLAGLSSNCKE